MIGHLLDLGLTDYRETRELQACLHEARMEGRIGDTVLVTEHYPVYTMGRTTRMEHMGTGWSGGRIGGVPVYASDRGGSVTYHGPGQMVGYPILKIRDYCAGPKAYVACLERTLIRALMLLGVPAARRDGMPGVWVHERKIAAVGVRISRGVTCHGFALNVVNDLSPFATIVPCGLSQYTVTSVANETGAAVGFDHAVRAVIEAFREVFGMSLKSEPVEAFLASAGAESMIAVCDGNGGA